MTYPAALVCFHKQPWQPLLCNREEQHQCSSQVEKLAVDQFMNKLVKTTNRRLHDLTKAQIAVTVTETDNSHFGRSKSFLFMGPVKVSVYIEIVGALYTPLPPTLFDVCFRINLTFFQSPPNTHVFLQKSC